MKELPIFDYHCHLDPKQIWENQNFENITQIWLAGDHYKWRAMRIHGVSENLITGDASDWEKFEAWAETVPHLFGNPLYHWTHMELRTFFGIDSCYHQKQRMQFGMNVMKNFKHQILHHVVLLKNQMCNLLVQQMIQQIARFHQLIKDDQRFRLQ